MSKKPKYTQDYIDKATENIESDRALASQLLYNLMNNINTNPTDRTQRLLGEVAAKYLETLQRSNEQLVKLTALVHKINSDNDKNLNKKEMESIFDDLVGGN
jgi:hypothetical protein